MGLKKSACDECFFSQAGILYYKLRTRLQHAKVTKMLRVKARLHADHPARRMRRIDGSFGTVAESAALSETVSLC
jgi:hypothetical protein